MNIGNLVRVLVAEDPSAQLVVTEYLSTIALSEHKDVQIVVPASVEEAYRLLNSNNIDMAIIDYYGERERLAMHANSKLRMPLIITLARYVNAKTIDDQHQMRFILKPELDWQKFRKDYLELESIVLENRRVKRLENSLVGAMFRQSHPSRN